MTFTTYTVKSRKNGFILVFRYDFKGFLRAFEILEGQLNFKQRDWLYRSPNFPTTEEQMKLWQAILKKNFEIHKQDPEVTFEAFWEAYGLKTRKKETEGFWKKMSPGDRFKALAGIRQYNNHLRLHAWKNKVDPIRYLKHRRYEDEF